MKYLLYTMILFLVLPLQAQPQTDSLSFDPQISALMDQVDSSNISQYIEDLANANGSFTRVAFTAGNVWAANYIKQKFEGFGGMSTVELDTFFISSAPSPYNITPQANVMAMLNGGSGTTKYLVVGGHYDCSASLDPNLNWNNNWNTAHAQGADDNATGIAAILEIARILSDPANQFVPTTSICFVAFAAEETHPETGVHHKGSEHFVTTASANGDNITGAFILDMIGYNSTENLHYSIVSNGASTSLGDRLLDVNQVYQHGLHSNSYPYTFATYSDHEQFWRRGYKAVLLIENAPPWNNNSPWYLANPYYHTEQDTPEKINLEQVTQLTKTTLGAVVSFSGGFTGILSPDVFGSFPRTISLEPNYPNPFNSTTTIRYRLNSKSKVKIQVFDLNGRKIANLFEGVQPEGEHQLMWEAKNFAGEELPSGVYLLSLSSQSQREIRKMMLIK